MFLPPWCFPLMFTTAALRKQEHSRAPHLLLTFMPGALQHLHSAHTVADFYSLRIVLCCLKKASRCSSSTPHCHAAQRDYLTALAALK